MNALVDLPWREYPASLILALGLLVSTHGKDVRIGIPTRR